MGPLAGLKVLEIAGIGPAPFCAMMLADMGADVVRVDRRAAADLGISLETRFDVLGRGRRSIALDLKQSDDLATVRDLVSRADVLLEGFRPGVMERLGLGPDDCLALNSRLVYGRMTGWGQDGPLAKAAGHDINYIALSGALATIGPRDAAPVPPLNLVGDFGGGGMLLAMGVLAAVFESSRSGKGQVVDAAMVDGALSLMTPIYAMKAGGRLPAPRGENQLDSGSYFYEVYECSDGEFISIASIEMKFHAELLQRLEIDPATMPPQRDRAHWPAMKERLTALFKTKTRAHWCSVLEGTDVCFAPVLSMEEAHTHPHNVARNAFIDVGGMRQPAPAPRFQGTPLAHPTPAGTVKARDTLKAWGFSDAEAEKLGG